MIFASALGTKAMRWKACLLAAFALLAPLLRAVDDPTYSGLDRKPLAMGLAASGPSIASTNIAGTAFDCIEQPDGKIVVVGNNQRTLLAMRFHANGATDTTFGDNGVFVLPNYDIWYEGGMGVALQSNGSIVLVTKTYIYTNPNGNGSGIVVRLTPAGQLDTSFAGSGVKLINGGDRAFLNRVFVTPDDKIVTGGNYPSGIWFARYLANGAEDATFGSNGKAFIQQATQNNHSGQVGQLVLLPDGKMLMLSVGILSATREAWVVDRVTATGALDPNFNRISLPYDGSNTYIGSMARLSDGRIAVVIPRSEPSYPVGDMVGLYSAEGVREGAVSDSAFAGGRGLGYWDNATALVVRSDGSLCGGMKESVVQFLPSLQKIVPGVTSYGYGLGLLEALLDGGLLRVKGSSVYRYAADGASGVTYTMSGTTNTTYPPDIVIEQLFSPITDGGSRSFGSAAVNGTPSTLSFTIRNTGLGSLKDLAISVTGTHAADFTVSALASTTVVSGSGQSFTVSFAPKATGTRTAKLQIASNDPDENPFDITLTGQGSSSSPEIVVESPTSISDGGSVAFSSVNVGAPALTRTFTIRNAGQTNLTGLAISFTGDHAADFSATALTSSTLAPGGSQTFTLSFTPKAAGARTATLAIASNDVDENPFDIMLAGQGLEASPEIVVESSGALIDGISSVVLGVNVVTTPALTRSVTIRNTGLGTLRNLAITIDGGHAGDFAASPLTSPTLAPGASQTFTVSFSAKGTGSRRAGLHIASNDADENPFDITLYGTGSLLDLRFADGSALTQPYTRLDFGSVALGTTAERSLTLQNLGAQPLTGLLLSFSGENRGGFSASPKLPDILAAGESFTFQLQFRADFGRYRSCAMLVKSSQGLESLINISALVHSPRIRVDDGASIPVRSPSQDLFFWGYLNSYYNSDLPSDYFAGARAIAANGQRTLVLKSDGTVYTWGQNLPLTSLPTVPSELGGVVAIAAGYWHNVALLADGSVTTWVYATLVGASTMPAGLAGVVAIAAGDNHSLALKADGTLVSWGLNTERQCSIPAGLVDVVAIAAGGDHSVAITQQGGVVAWGRNDNGQTNVPPNLSGVVAVAAGSGHTVALKQDGQVVAWGRNDSGQTQVPATLSDVVAIAAGSFHTLALRRDGTVVAWGKNSSQQSTIPAGLTNVTAIAGGGAHSVVIGDRGLGFQAVPIGSNQSQHAVVTNTGDLPLRITKFDFTGPDADQFLLGSVFPTDLDSYKSSNLSVILRPSRVGRLKAQMQIHSNDPQTTPFVVRLQGVGTYSVDATSSRIKGSPFTYGPLTSDRTTGLVMQQMTFANPTSGPLPGLRLILSNIAAGVTVNSSSAGEVPGTVEVIYSKPIAMSEILQFTLTYFDSKRRTTTAIQPLIRAEALLEPEPRSEPVKGTLTPLLGVRDTAQGPLVEWTSKPNAVYVVEYSDDRGLTWFSAVHRLTRNSTRISWVDRGQPETFFKPVNKAARSYRVKRL